MQRGGVAGRHPAPGAEPGDFIKKSSAAAGHGGKLQQARRDQAGQLEEDGDVDEISGHGQVLCGDERVAGESQQRVVRLPPCLPEELLIGGETGRRATMGG
eukprot:10670810-Heterocapsa_arctica.AAC.1